MKLSKAKGSMTLVHFGRLLMRDPDATWKLFETYQDEQGRPRSREHSTGTIPKSGTTRFDLDEGGLFMMMCKGGKIAGQVHTAQLVMKAPFVLKIDAPAYVPVEARRAQRFARRPKALALAVNKALR